MKNSYKIALLVAAGLFAVVLGYYAFQDPAADPSGAGEEVPEEFAQRTPPSPGAEPDADVPGRAAGRNPSLLRSSPDPAPVEGVDADADAEADFFEDMRRRVSAARGEEPPTTAVDTPRGETGVNNLEGGGPADLPIPVQPDPAASSGGSGPAAANTGNGRTLAPIPNPGSSPGTTPDSAAANAPATTGAGAGGGVPQPPATTNRAATAPLPGEEPAAVSAAPIDPSRPYFGPLGEGGRVPAAGNPQAPQTRTGNRTYTIQSGDTFAAIAARELGDERRWVDVAQQNPLVDPMKLRVGQEIRLPAAGGARGVSGGGAGQPTRDAAERRSVGEGVRYTVQSGDTLSDIAAQFYGQAGQWRRVFEANRGVLDSPDDLQPGQELTIPPGGRGAK